MMHTHTHHQQLLQKYAGIHSNHDGMMQQKRCIQVYSANSDNQLSQSDISRRQLMLTSSALGLTTSLPSASYARGFNVKPEDFERSAELGLDIVEIEGGDFFGGTVKEGDLVLANFDVRWKTMVVASTRDALPTGKNISVAEPILFRAGGQVTGLRRPIPGDSRKNLKGSQKPGAPLASDDLQDAPEPPLVLSKLVIGMKKNAKRAALVNQSNVELGFREQDLPEMVQPDDSYVVFAEVLEINPEI